MSFVYFADGSNMLTTRLKARCPSVRVVGTAVARDHRLEFSKPSIDKSGKATLVRAPAGDGGTPGVLFEIDVTERDNLDRAEGAGNGYDRHDSFEVASTQERQVLSVMTYLATRTDAALIPYDWYLALFVAGALEHGLGDQHLAALKAVQSNSDPKEDRQSRQDALMALALNGIHDYRALLRSG